ncbi:MAG: ketopantoate reductase family protein [Anaerolineae bacterium]
MRIAIMGTGGLGGYFGAKLAFANMDVVFIARGELLRSISQNGIKVHSPKGDFAIKSIQATDNPNLIGPVDLILLCVKTYDLDGALQSLLPLIGPHTTVIPLLNGFEHIAKMKAVLGDSHVLGGISMTFARKGEPGVVHHLADLDHYQIEFGEWEGTISQRCQQVQEVWEQADVKGIAVSNIAERMWWKLAGICGAGVFAVARGDKSKVWIPETQALFHGAISEVVAIARSQQILLDDALPDKFVNVIVNAPATYKPSLLTDLEQGRRLEIASTNGFISRLGKDLNIATAVNDFIYACLKPHMNGSVLANKPAS